MILRVHPNFYANEKQCAECWQHRKKGYVIFGPDDADEQICFVCDKCLDKAAKTGCAAENPQSIASLKRVTIK